MREILQRHFGLEWIIRINCLFRLSILSQLNWREGFLVTIVLSLVQLPASSLHHQCFSILKFDALCCPYGIDSDSFKSEIHVFRCHFSKHQESKVDVLRFIERGYRECYSQIFKVYRIAVTLPVTTAGNERSFSTMKRTKSYLRSTMLDDRLGDQACLSINRERAKELEMDLIVDTFGRQKRKIVLF